MGTGYVGLVSGTCFAETGNDVLCVDIDPKKVEMLQGGKIPIYEPGLSELVERNAAQERLRFTTDVTAGVEHGEIIFCAVGTPPDKSFKADVSAVRAVSEAFGKYLKGYKILVNKSTVPVGTGALSKSIIEQQLAKRGNPAGDEFDIVSNPEFLREGAAVNDTMKPERIVIGSESERAQELMTQLYKPFLRYNMPVLHTNIESAELIKYASNSFLATKISFINEIAGFCELTGANIVDVARGMGADSRIGRRFLHAGIGYGGSCFPKDIGALINSGKEKGYSFRILEAVEQVNDRQKKEVFEKLLERIPKLEDKTIAVLGLAFKPKTDDMRDAPSIKIIKKLQAEGAKVRVFDPVAMKNAVHYLANTNLTYAKNAYEATENADALLLLTEWDAFRNIDRQRIKSTMVGNLLIDGRNIFDPVEMKSIGFDYISIGRDTSQQNPA